MIVLIGFMGSGKTTVARLLAARLGRPYVDSDRIVEERAGKTIREIFADDGEPAFRDLERKAVAEVIAGRDDAIVSLGGGALTDEGSLALLAGHTVVRLDVSLERALERSASDDGKRPLLVSRDPASLYEERRGPYRDAATASVPTDDRSPWEVVDELMEVLGIEVPSGSTRSIRVATESRPYTVTVGRGLVSDLTKHVRFPEAAEKAFVVSHPSLERHRAAVAEALTGAGLEVHTLQVSEGEGSKSLATVGELYQGLVSARAHRDDLVVSVGGGVVGDVAGFVAATYMRGIAHVSVPTTLLAQVDAAIGGKTGVNLGTAKNIVGSIHQPLAVLCDVDLLATCPEAELRSGLAEVVKYGFIADPEILEIVRGRRDALPEGDPELLVDLVARSVAVKASVVASDERERGDRAFLNYGHTFGHAIESVVGLGRIRHGEAVALGMTAAAYAAEALGWIAPAVTQLHLATLEAAGLPTHAALDFDRLEEAWTHDKKYRRGLRFVLLRALAQPVAGVEVPRAVLRDAVARLARQD